MNIGLSGFSSDIRFKSSATSSDALFHWAHTASCLSSSVIKPLWYCLLILSTTSCARATISSFLSVVITSAADTVIPAIVEYLNPKSFNLSSIIDVSVVLYLLNTWAMICPKVFLTNGATSGISLITFGISVPISSKYLLGVNPSILSLVPSFRYGNVSGKISLKIILPAVVTKYLSFWSSINNLCLNELVGRAILVWSVISLLS